MVPICFLLDLEADSSERLKIYFVVACFYVFIFILIVVIVLGLCNAPFDDWENLGTRF